MRPIAHLKLHFTILIIHQPSEMTATFLAALSGFVALGMVTGHTLFTNLIINDNDQGAGTCIRMPKNPSTATNPINSLTGEELACGESANSEPSESAGK